MPMPKEIPNQAPITDELSDDNSSLLSLSPEDELLKISQLTNTQSKNKINDFLKSRLFDQTHSSETKSKKSEQKNTQSNNPSEYLLAHKPTDNLPSVSEKNTAVAPISPIHKKAPPATPSKKDEMVSVKLTDNVLKIEIFIKDEIKSANHRTNISQKPLSNQSVNNQSIDKVGSSKSAKNNQADNNDLVKSNTKQDNDSSASHLSANLLDQHLDKQLDKQDDNTQQSSKNTSVHLEKNDPNTEKKSDNNTSDNAHSNHNNSTKQPKAKLSKSQKKKAKKAQQQTQAQSSKINRTAEDHQNNIDKDNHLSIVNPLSNHQESDDKTTLLDNKTENNKTENKEIENKEIENKETADNETAKKQKLLALIEKNRQTNHGLTDNANENSQALSYLSRPKKGGLAQFSKWFGRTNNTDNKTGNNFDKNAANLGHTDDAIYQKTDEKLDDLPNQSNTVLAKSVSIATDEPTNHLTNRQEKSQTDDVDKSDLQSDKKSDTKPTTDLKTQSEQKSEKKSDLPPELAHLNPSVLDPDNPLRKSWGINRHLDELDKPLLSKTGGLESQTLIDGKLRRPKDTNAHHNELDKPLLSSEGALESQAYVGKSPYRPKTTPRPHFAPWYYQWAVALVRPLYRFKLARQEDTLPYYGRQMHERFVGAYTRPKPKYVDNVSRKVIWCHAVSLGELNTVYPLLRSFLDDGHGLCVTCTTKTGFERAEVLFESELMTGQVVHGFVPVDDLPVVGRFIRSINPHLAIFVETELWANTLFVLTVNRIPAVLVNARLKEKSFNNYQKFPELAKGMMNNLWQVLAQDDESAKRFVALGLPKERVAVVDSLKWSSGIADGDVLALGEQFGRKLGIVPKTRPIWIAGSTHDGEEMAILMAHKQLLQTHPNALLILVPRHPERFEEVARLCQSLFKTTRRSDDGQVGDNQSVLLIDKMGELSAWYGVADVAFVAGSLVDKGGHNPIEPASLGVPVIMGKYTQSCDKVVTALLDADAMVQTGDSHDTVAITKAVAAWFDNPVRAKQAGARGRALVLDKKDAMARQKAYLLPYLK